MASEELFRFERAALGYTSGVTVLHDVDLTIRRNDFLGIVGPNGSGKSTLLRSVLALLEPTSGKVTRRAGIRYGYVPQRQALDPIYPLRCADVVRMGIYREIGYLRRPGREVMERAVRALDAVGIAHLAERLYRDLSGGQQQRTLVARALVSEPDLLVLDEPTNDLDLAGERGIMELVTRLHDQGRTVLLVSHMLNVVAAYVHRIALIDRGTLSSGTIDEMLTADRLSALYGMRVSVVEAGGRKVVLPLPEQSNA
jgi:ABC-type Mn2+/Zn2+ transport system ATPase subunit